MDEDVATVKHVQHDPTEAAALSDQERVMLRFVDKLTQASASMTREDVAELRAAGFTDVQVLEIVQLAAWFNFMTRVADALGVEVEPWRAEWRQTLLPDPAPSVAEGLPR
jgi:uncharacterized peroxidase-related enzyme